MKELNQEQKDLLEKINKCCIEIAKKNNYNIKFDKIEFLEKKGFYDYYSPDLFKSLKSEHHS
jgi:hypothetical protein